MYIQTKHKNDLFGITRAKKLFELLVQNKEIFQKFGDVEVTIEPDSAEVEKLINRKDIDKLMVDIVRPNPDDIGSIEQVVFERMKKRNLKKQRIEYKSVKDENLVLDDDLKTEVKIAASNGKVVAEGVNVDNEKWKISTEETNLVIKTSYIADRTEENRGEDPAEKHLIETAFNNHNEIIK